MVTARRTSLGATRWTKSQPPRKLHECLNNPRALHHNPALKEHDYRLIGGLVTAFGYLEHELVRASIGICGKPDSISTEDKERIERALEDGATLGDRLRLFCTLAREKQIDTDKEIGQFEQKIQEGVRWRNMVCHGQWERLKNGNLRVSFYRKGCISRGAPDIAELTQEQILEIAKITFENAKALSVY